MSQRYRRRCARCRGSSQAAAKRSMVPPGALAVHQIVRGPPRDMNGIYPPLVGAGLPRPVSDVGGSVRDTFKTSATNAKTPLVRGGARVAGGAVLRRPPRRPRMNQASATYPAAVVLLFLAIMLLPTAAADPVGLGEGG